MEEGGKDKKSKRKPGWPCKGKGISDRERSASVSSMRSMEEFVKRKREERKERRRRKEEIIFKRNKLAERSPVKKEGVRIMFRELLEEMRKMRREMKEQKAEIREEIKMIRAEIHEREDSWKKEKEGLREINEIKRRMEGMRVYIR